MNPDGDGPHTMDRPRTWLREASGSLADLGVLVPIAVALIVVNGLSATATLLPTALLYLVVAAVYGLPVAVQPLKAFGAIAIATGAGPDLIAAGSLVMGVIFLALAATGLIDVVARIFPTGVIRGIQLAVALVFAKLAITMLLTTPTGFTAQLPAIWGVLIAAGLLVALMKLRERGIFVIVLIGIVLAIWLTWSSGGAFGWGPTTLTSPTLDGDLMLTAMVVLVLPQLPLTFANSCLAPADAAVRYFGDAGRRVRPGRLATTLGSANLVAGAITGMPVCHGAGGMSAHVAFGARTWRAPAFIGGSLLAIAVIAGAALGEILPRFPIPLLAALLCVAAVAHARLLSDVRRPVDWLTVAVVGIGGIVWNLGIAMLLGLSVSAVSWWITRRSTTARRDAAGPAQPHEHPDQIRRQGP